MAEVAIPRQMFQEILRLIAELRPQPRLHRHEAFDGHALKSNRREECVQMPSKNGQISSSAAVRGARITAAVPALRRSCQNATKAQKSTPI
jgi:hypothetical protein